MRQGARQQQHALRRVQARLYARAALRRRLQERTEVCDDGKNDGSYGTCSPGCVAPPRCGDGVVQSTAGEVCDQGAQNDSAAYGMGKCLKSCRPAPYSATNRSTWQGEVCDDGVNSGMAGSCDVDCKGYKPLPSCGDGTIQPPEQCDDGATNGQVQAPATHAAASSAATA